MAELAVTDDDRPRSRRFGLGDVMILIVALALGLALAGPAFIIIADAIRSAPRNHFRTFAGAVQLGRILNIIVLNFLFFFIPACLILRLRRPRPPLSTLIHQPGFAACAAPVAVVLASLPLALFAPSSGLAEQVIAIGGQALSVAAVPLAWLSLIATRRWAPEPSWIDRLGRILGVLWTVSLPAHLVLIRLPY
jgi:hypothetical protein